MLFKGWKSYWYQNYYSCIQIWIVYWTVKCYMKIFWNQLTSLQHIGQTGSGMSRTVWQQSWQATAWPHGWNAKTSSFGWRQITQSPRVEEIDAAAATEGWLTESNCICLTLNILTIVTFPISDAKSSAVLLSLFFTEKSALNSKSSITHSWFPPSAAKWRGVQPFKKALCN